MPRRLPTDRPDTPSLAGRRAERELARRSGARLTPASGAGRIKGDMTVGPFVLEHKLVNHGTKSITLSLSQVLSTLTAAELTGRSAGLVIDVPEHNMTIEATIRRGRP